MTKACYGGSIDVPRETQKRLTTFVELLLAESKRQNLIARSTADDVWNRHIDDSLQLTTYMEDHRTQKILDLGSGPGLPGLVLAIARPDWVIHLVESRRKRCEFLAAAIDHLELRNARVHCSNVRTLEPFKVDVITARAFAPLPSLIDMAKPFARMRTRWVLPRGAKGATELAELPKRHRSMFHVEQSLTDSDAVILVGKGVP